MYHYQPAAYTEEPTLWRDAEDVREELSLLHVALTHARTRLDALYACREAVLTHAEEETEEKGAAAETVDSLLCGIEEAESEIDGLREDISDLKNELEDSLYMIRAGREESAL